MEDFNQPKIIWKRIGSILRFSYDDKGCLGLDSTMGHYLLKDSPKTGTGDLLVSVQAIEPARIPYYANCDSHLSELLNKQVTHYDALYEKEINDIVFSMYELSPIEREYVTLYVKQSQQSQ